MTIQDFNRTLYPTVLGVLLMLPMPVAAQQPHNAGHGNRFPTYVVEDLGTLGGPYSFAYSLNDAGVVSGGSATAAQNGDPTQAVVNAPQTAFVWDHGRLRNLRTKGGPDSAGAAANLSGLVLLDSETAVLDPHGADVCAFGTHLQCLAAIGKDRRFTPLALLEGGHNSYALDLNDLGQAVGFSDTSVFDLGCAAASTAGFLFKSVVWQPDGRVRPLAAYQDDTVSWGFGINNHGQVAGASGVCANTTPPPYVSAPHAILWQPDGTAINLGSLGGAFSAASAINEHGDVSGTSNTANGLPRPFLWTPESHTLIELKPPPGFPIAVNPCCRTINDRREIVGFMLDAHFNSHAFLWKNGEMADLNDLIGKGSLWTLQSAAGINASGQIAGQGMINGEVHAFLATPCPPHEDSGDRCGNDGH